MIIRDPNDATRRYTKITSESSKYEERMMNVNVFYRKCPT